MPKAAARACVSCGVAVTDGSNRCALHKLAERPAWARTTPTYKRESGRRLQRKRAELFAREPYCRRCADKGFVTIAVIRDHIKPLEEGGEDTDENTQPLCLPCSDAKTKVEARRGRLRAKGRGG